MYNRIYRIVEDFIKAVEQVTKNLKGRFFIMAPC